MQIIIRNVTPLAIFIFIAFTLILSDIWFRGFLRPSSAAAYLTIYWLMQISILVFSFNKIRNANLYKRILLGVLTGFLLSFIAYYCSLGFYFFDSFIERFNNSVDHLGFWNMAGALITVGLLKSFLLGGWLISGVLFASARKRSNVGSIRSAI